MHKTFYFVWYLLLFRMNYNQFLTGFIKQLTSNCPAVFIYYIGYVGTSEQVSHVTRWSFVLRNKKKNHK